jgi:stearoyl-CoA desaturase (Delta-9 desaturase)
VKKYQRDISACDSHLVSLLTFGEGYQNYHHTFPTDYRVGARWSHWDPTKWLIRTLSLVGLAGNLQKTSWKTFMRARLECQQAAVDARMAKLPFGPEEWDLPMWSREKLEDEVAGGRVLVVLDNLVHDVSDFLEKHPGGPNVLLRRSGKDATDDFNGVVTRHSKYVAAPTYA